MVSTQADRKWALFSLYRQQFLRYEQISISVLTKLPYLGMKLGHWQNLLEVADILSLYPKGSKLTWFSLCGKRFPRYWPIFKISIFGHEIWNFKTGPRVVYVLSSYPVKIKLIFALYGQPFSWYGQIFEISIFGREIWNVKKGPKVAYVPFFYPKGRN